MRPLSRPGTGAACHGESELDETSFDHSGVVRNMVGELAGDVDTSGVEIMRLVRMVCNIYDARRIEVHHLLPDCL